MMIRVLEPEEWEVQVVGWEVRVVVGWAEARVELDHRREALLRGL